MNQVHIYDMSRFDQTVVLDTLGIYRQAAISETLLKLIFTHILKST